MNFKSGFLYARPSFTSGVARLGDIFGTFDAYNESANGEIADARAILADWGMTGQDIGAAIDEWDG